jgi:hypothetical protein
MNRFTLFFILLLLSLPVYGTGEGLMEVETEAENSASDRLPVVGVSLYTAGLAQIVHETIVSGDEVLSFPVDPRDIDDLLKSLSIEDLDGGIVDTVNFDSNEPLSVSLGDLRLNPSGSPSITDFLLRTQGESVTVESKTGVHSGRIFSVEVRKSEEESKTILNLMESGKIFAVDISELKSLRFDDRVLQDELSSALKLIADSRLKSVRKLRISSRGRGERRLRLSYIKEVPLWKTSYRIVLDEEGQARLEGWAIVQNTSGSSWEDIRLSFVAGRPNAFAMDLSTPRYITRKRLDVAAAAPMEPEVYEKAYAPEPSASRSRVFAEAPARADEVYEQEEAESFTPPALVSQASGAREGNFYRYNVRHPVTVNARSSAMIPILTEEAAGSSLGIYDPAYGVVFKGIRLSNKTDAHWAAGPVTVREGRFYGGDAMLPEMIPGSERLVTYAEHGTLDVDKIITSEPQRITALKIAEGVLHRTDKITRETEYRIEGAEKELLIIHPREAGWKLIDSPPPSKETQGEYRFSITEWEEPLKIGEEYIISRTFSLNSFTVSDLQMYIEWSEISSEMKRVFTKIADLRQAVENIRLQINTLNGRVNRIERDQNRVRENMKVLDKESDLFHQYSESLAAQEEEIRQLYSDISAKQSELSAAEGKLREYIDSLEI